MSWFKKAFSIVLPMRLQRMEGRYHRLELTYEDGELVVNSGSANQSFGTLHRLWQEVLEHVAIRERVPGSCLLLGHGAGSVERIIHRELGMDTRITGVEGDPMILDLRNAYFPASRPDLVEVLQSDAFAFLEEHDRTYDLVIVDLFHELDVPEAMAGPDFADHLRRATADHGLLLMNTIAHDEASTDRSGRIEANLRHVFKDVRQYAFGEVNRVLIAQ
ncbi:MAG: fused MFS/spermidine synthase [Flavobacteriales bacterium]|nr:fused MFS/spermidine synthase [Flavobacteriales bacterium]